MLKTFDEILDLHCTGCGSDDFSISEDVGWDIDEESEQHQHLLICNNCKRSAIASDIYLY